MKIGGKQTDEWVVGAACYGSARTKVSRSHVYKLYKHYSLLLICNNYDGRMHHLQDLVSGNSNEHTLSFAGYCASVKHD